MSRNSAEVPDAPPLIPRHPPAWAAPTVAAVVILFTIVLRLGIYGHRVMLIGFGIPLVLFGWLRSRRYLWITTIAFVTITLLKFFLLLPMRPNEGGAPLSIGTRTLDAVMVLTDMLVIATVVHVLIGARAWLETRNLELSDANRALAHREHEIARANDELQSQAEALQNQAAALEAQTEELRISNTGLADREQTLQTLLDLSRALTTELTREEALDHICRSIAPLIGGPAIASAILERAERHLVVRCHHGFGGALDGGTIPLDRSFAAMVLAEGRSGYVENLAQRPDLMVPQPQGGPAVAAILAAPLRIAGKPVGTIEVYSRVATRWTESQMALLESLAAQTSISLETARLFETIEQERARLEAVLRATPVGIAVATPDGRDVRVNPAGAALLDVAPDANLADPAFIGAVQMRVGNRPMTHREQPLARAVLEGVETDNQELDVRLADGRRLILLVNAAPIRDSDGDIAGGVMTFTNITAQKALQRELDLRRTEAEEASVRKTRFLAAVSHDIRTPANAISLLAELIRRAAANPALAQEVPELAQELQASAISLVNLLSDVLDLARFDSGKIDVQEAEFNLADLFAEENRQMQPLAREKGLELQFEAPQPPILLRADRIKLSRVLGNLVGNGIKFTDRGSVRVTARLTEDGLPEIRVTDTGIGIPPEHMRHIFDEFFQLRNPERDRNKGTGLGLTICNRLVEAIGGRLEVQSTAGAGSTFSVVLPASAVVVPATEDA